MENELYYYEHNWDHKENAECFSAENNNFLPHYHSSIEIIFIESGELYAIINGKQVIARKNQILIVPSYYIHSYKTPKQVKTLVLIVPLEYTSYFRKLFSRRTFTDYIYSGERSGEIIFALKQLANQDPDVASQITHGYVEVILGILTESLQMTEITDKTNFHKFQEILKYVNDNFTANLSLKNVSEKFFYSPCHLSHLFNEHIGYSFPEYLNILRSKYCAKLLIEENITISKAAFVSGFNSINSFNRNFKRQFGITPTEYKNKYSKNTGS